jgi:hypothetical protein
MNDLQVRAGFSQSRSKARGSVAAARTHAVRTSAHISSYGGREAAPRPVIIRYIGRHLGFLAGLLLVGVAFGIAYRYLLDPLEERTLPFYMRSALHAAGLVCSGWAVHLAFASMPRSRAGRA